MPITEQHAGRSYRVGHPYVVGEQSIADFADALGGRADQGVPPTFGIVIAAKAWDAMFADPELELELQRVIHADQRFSFTRALQVGDQISAELSITKVRERGARQFITCEVSFVDGDAQAIGVATSTFLQSKDVSGTDSAVEVTS